jgi:hypothetical protein
MIHFTTHVPEGSPRCASARGGTHLPYEANRQRPSAPVLVTVPRAPRSNVTRLHHHVGGVTFDGVRLGVHHDRWHPGPPDREVVSAHCAVGQEERSVRDETRA